MKKVTLVMQSAVNGGVQRVMINLAKGFVKQGVSVDFLICDASGEMLVDIPSECNVIDLGKRKYRGDLKVLISLNQIIHYMKKYPKSVMIGAPGLAGTVLAFAKLFCKKSKVLVICDNKCSLLKDGSLYHTAVYYINKILYGNVDLIVAAHKAAAEDIFDNYYIEKEKLHVIYHPLIEEEVVNVVEPIREHRYIENREDYKILISIGRMVPEKDFANLISAFSLVRKRQKVRLIVLGDGLLRNKIEEQVTELGLSQDIDLYGYTDKVFEFIKAADALVLSSKEEAFGNVLIEALACGVPIVATDCESGGPRDILDGENAALYGALCPCNNSELLAKAIEETLERSYNVTLLKERARVFTIDYSSSQYLKLIEGITHE